MDFWLKAGRQTIWKATLYPAALKWMGSTNGQILSTIVYHYTRDFIILYALSIKVATNRSLKAPHADNACRIVDWYTH